MSTSTTTLAPDNSGPVELWINCLQILVGAFLYGLYCLLFVRAVQILWRRMRQLERQSFLLGAIILLFLLSSAQISLLMLEAAIVVEESSLPLASVLTSSLLVYVTSCICSDALLIYRCFVIWDDNIYIIVAPICLLINAAAFGYIRNLRLFQILSLTTAIAVTLLTVLRVAWSAYTRRSLLTSSMRRQYISASATIIESGAIYALFVSVHFAIFSAGSPAAPIIFAAVGQIVGIAPTLIIVRAGLPSESNVHSKTLSGSSNMPMAARNG